MGDMGEVFREMADESKAKREHNRHSSATLLDAKGVSYESRNSGAHLIVSHNEKIVDFWPGTGKYCFRGTGKYKRGVFNLLRDLGVDL